MGTIRYGYLDALRGLAILMVIFVHVGQRVPAGTIFKTASQYGQYGVQLFFVVSAFSMCISLEGVKVGVSDYWAFLSKRYFRIAPMYCLTLAVFFLTTYIIEQQTGETGFFTATEYYTPARIIANVLLLHAFMESANNTIVPGGWSIACEFSFYLIFPWLLTLVRWDRKQLFIVPGLCWGGLVVLVQAVPALTARQGFLYYSLLFQIPCFMIGMAVHAMGGNRIFALSTGVMAPAAFYYLYRAHQVSWGWQVSPVCAAVAAAGLLLLFRRFALGDGLLAKLGRLSFSIYCLHYLFVRGVADPMVPLLEAEHWPPVLIPIAAYAVVCLLSIVAAWFTYAWVEIPFIRLGRNISERVRNPKNNEAC